MRRRIVNGPVRALLLGSGLLFSVSACESSATAPGAELAGTFVLTTVAGVPLEEAPFLPTAGGSARIEGRFVADTIVFAADGTGRRTFTSQTRELSTGREFETTLRFTFRHVREGDAVTLDRFTCTPNCSVAQPDALRFSVRGSALEAAASNGVFRYLIVAP